ncbi:hypothetical protein R6Q59_035638 [Mikania micrantha]
MTTTTRRPHPACCTSLHQINEVSLIKIPLFETPDGVVFDINAIAIYGIEFEISYIFHKMSSLAINTKILKSTMNIRRFTTKKCGFFNITEEDNILVRGERDLKFSHMLSYTYGLGPKLTVHSDISFESYHESYSKTALYKAKRLSNLNTTVKYGMRNMQDLFEIIEKNSFTKIVFLNPKFESFKINPKVMGKTRDLVTTVNNKCGIIFV